MPLGVILDITQLVKCLVAEEAFEELIQTSSYRIAFIQPLEVTWKYFFCFFELYIKYLVIVPMLIVTQLNIKISIKQWIILVKQNFTRCRAFPYLFDLLR